MKVSTDFKNINEPKKELAKPSKSLNDKITPITFSSNDNDEWASFKV